MSHKIAIIGEYWDAHEVRQRTPFVGPGGYALTKILEDAGIPRIECFLTNVFNMGVSDGIETICGSRDNGIPGRSATKPGKYVRAEFISELDRLDSELARVRPNIVVALGGISAWACFGETTINKVRGTVGPGIGGLKTIATYSPTAVIRDWSLRPVTVLDFIKAKRESAFPEIRLPQRELWIEPTYEDMEIFYDRYLKDAHRISFDIETSRDQITCIGFSPNPNIGLVVPFTNGSGIGGSYWPTLAEEVRALEWVRRVLGGPSEKVAQNGLYDIHFLWRRYGIAVNNFEHDTMLLHHSLQPESPKGLDFLGSVYTNEASWKLMRKRGKQTIKRDE